MVEFADLTKEQHKQLARIARRAVADARYNPDEIGACMMDLSAVHAHTPLDFDKLEGFDAYDFGHDMSGIRQYIDRETGLLRECFLPRCAAPVVID